MMEKVKRSLLSFAKLMRSKVNRAGAGEPMGDSGGTDGGRNIDVTMTEAGVSAKISLHLGFSKSLCFGLF